MNDQERDKAYRIYLQTFALAKSGARDSISWSALDTMSDVELVAVAIAMGEGARPRARTVVVSEIENMLRQKSEPSV